MKELSIGASHKVATEHATIVPEASIASAPPMESAAPPHPPEHKRFRFTAAVVAIVIAAGVLAVIMRRTQSRAVTGGPFETAVAVRKNFLSVLRLTGSTEALRSRPVLAPQLAGAQLNSMVVTKLMSAGTRVHKGDLLVEFDRQAQIKDALDKKGAYEDLVDQVAEKRAAEEAARAKDEDDLRQAQDALAKAQLEIGKNEILSRIDVEKNQEALTEAQQTLAQLQHTFDLKRQAAAADIRTLEIQRDRARATMLYAESNAQKMSIVSPMDGIVVLNMVWLSSRMGQVQEGDEVRPGVPFMKVVDPSDMQVRVEVNQEDFPLLQVGQQARITLDAYPSLAFQGTLEELDPLGQPSQQSDTIRTFAAVFAIHGANSKLMPDLSAAVDVELANVKNALVVPAQGVGIDTRGQYVLLKSGGAFERSTVKTGPTNGVETVIDAGLKPNDVIQVLPLSSSGLSQEN